MNRRDFMVRGTAAAGVGVAALAMAGENLPATGRPYAGLSPYKVIIDARFRESCGFGSSAARRGCEIRPIHGDVTALWFEDLQPHWARRKEAIVGMTTGTSLLCLEQLGWDQWMRVVARIEHQSQPDGTVRHRLFMAEHALREASSGLEGNGPWAERIGASLIERTGAEYGGRPMHSELITRPPRADWNVSLVSWVMMARSGAGAAKKMPYHIETEASI